MKSRPSYRKAIIRLASDGFSILEADGTLHDLAWASVKEVFAFKLDLLMCDTIRLGFRLSDGTYLQVDEDDTGYRELVAEIERRFDLVEKDWWTKVAFPAFATNRTTLWGEPSPQP